MEKEDESESSNRLSSFESKGARLLACSAYGFRIKEEGGADEEKGVEDLGELDSEKLEEGG